MREEYIQLLDEGLWLMAGFNLLIWQKQYGFFASASVTCYID
jgi:hypothetical protein